ncbi:hypothetical protein E1258_04165 [Micromonospora sp. KC207]|uniref:alpha/beta fold hydrolase n=1 Tax=Micromonospora sp. KC207 TaxID=2530377 RepID=UPI00104B4426|nr:alpha/beta hydrolase [Micromonospora sp. KC207]TDC65968.1 hypothetical protein E1258_04165 [Micromonospora sp. KC207]
MLALFLLLAVAGAVYEGLAERGDAKRYPVPGRMVDVGGHRLHLHCTGAGGRTVVLEAGLGESSATWATIQQQLSGGGRVCSYDRAGYAWSEPGPSSRTAGQAADELHAMLLAADEQDSTSSSHTPTVVTLCACTPTDGPNSPQGWSSST